MIKDITKTHSPFFRSVDRRSRKAMESYLGEHFRYPTMNSWNRSTSYANNMKIHHLGISGYIADKLYDLIQTPEFYDQLHELIQTFNEKNDYLWQAGWNGRSGGYLVLYQGGKKPSEYRSYCTSCGQRNYRSVSENGTSCGRGGEEARVDYETPPMEIFTYPGRGLDMDEDFTDWTLYELQQRTELVQNFDRLADNIVSEALHIAETHSMEERTVYVPQKKFVMV